MLSSNAQGFALHSRCVRAHPWKDKSVAIEQMTYISTASPGITNADVESILLKSRHGNRESGVTGMLLFDGRRFLQQLEGAGEIRATARWSSSAAGWPTAACSPTGRWPIRA
jgi:hypothetical protein